MIEVMNVQRGGDAFRVAIGLFSSVLRFSSIDRVKPRVVVIQGLPLNLVKSIEEVLKNPEVTVYAQVSTPTLQVLGFELSQLMRDSELATLMLTGMKEDEFRIQLRKEELQKLHDTLLSFWTC